MRWQISSGLELFFLISLAVNELAVIAAALAPVLEVVAELHLRLVWKKEKKFKMEFLVCDGSQYKPGKVVVK